MLRMSRRFQNLQQCNFRTSIIVSIIVYNIIELASWVKKYERRDYDFTIEDIKNIKESQFEELIKWKWKINWGFELLISSYLLI